MTATAVALREATENGAAAPAFSLEAEMSVLGGMLIDGDAVGRATAQLEPRDFYREAHRRLFKAMVKLWKSGAPVEPVGLAEQLRDAGDFDSTGGAAYLAQLWDYVPSAANIEYHCGIVRRRARERRIQECAAELARNPTNAVAAGMLTTARAELDAGPGGATREPVFASLKELLERPELLAPPECVVPRIAYRGRLVILAGPDKSGKSTLLGHAVAAVSARRYFLGSPLSVRHSRAVLIGLEEALGDAVRRLSELEADPERVNLVVMPQPDLLQRTEALLEEAPADLLVIDSLQELARVTLGTVPDDGDNAGWSAVVRPLVALARRFDVAVVLLHHVRRSDGQYRGSSEIAAAADALLELATPKPDESPTMRRVSGRGRWNVEPFALELVDGRYELASGDKLSLDARVLLFIEQNPGATKRAVREGVSGKGITIDRTISNLLDRGAIVNRGTVGLSLYPASEGEQMGVL